MTKTLDDEEIETKTISRRSSMGIIGASVATVAGVLGGNVEEAAAQCSDSDHGRWSDPGGHGRHCHRTGCSDSDGGPHSDPGGHGRHCGHRPPPPPRHRGCTDHDSGHYADAAGHGRHCGGGGGHHCTDHDSGHYADPAGNGRHC